MFGELANKFLNYFTYAMIVVIVIGGIFFVWPKLERGKALRQQDEELSRVIESRRREIAEIKEYQVRFNRDPEFIERIARENNLVYPGELVFLFESER